MSLIPRLLSLVSSGQLPFDYRRIAETINQILQQARFLVGSDTQDTAFNGAFNLPDTSSTAQFIHLGTWSNVPQLGAKLSIQVTIADGFSASIQSNAEYSIFFKTSNNISFIPGSLGPFYADGEVWAKGDGAAIAVNQVLVVQNSINSYDFYLNCAQFTGQSIYNVIGSGSGNWTNVAQLIGSTPPAGNHVVLPVHLSTNGSFVASCSGFTTSPTPTILYSINQEDGVGVVTLTIPTFTGLSNSAFFFINGLPIAIRPATGNAFLPVAASIVEDNGTRQAAVSASVSSSTLTLYLNGLINGWTASGTKGLLQNLIIQYPLT